MRSTDERMNEVLGRARARENAARRRRQHAAAIIGGALSVVAVFAVGMGLSSAGLSGNLAPSGPFGLMGSVFSDNPAIGYIVVGLLGLVLGVVVTTLVFRLGGKTDGESSPAMQQPEETRIEDERSEP